MMETVRVTNFTSHHNKQSNDVKTETEEDEDDHDDDDLPEVVWLRPAGIAKNLKLSKQKLVIDGESKVQVDNSRSFDISGFDVRNDHNYALITTDTSSLQSKLTSSQCSIRENNCDRGSASFKTRSQNFLTAIHSLDMKNESDTDDDDFETKPLGQNHNRSYTTSPTDSMTNGVNYLKNFDEEDAQEIFGVDKLWLDTDSDVDPIGQPWTSPTDNLMQPGPSSSSISEYITKMYSTKRKSDDKPNTTDPNISILNNDEKMLEHRRELQYLQRRLQYTPALQVNSETTTGNPSTMEQPAAIGIKNATTGTLAKLLVKSKCQNLNKAARKITSKGLTQNRPRSKLLPKLVVSKRSGLPDKSYSRPKKVAPNTKQMLTKPSPSNDNGKFEVVDTAGISVMSTLETGSTCMPPISDVSKITPTRNATETPSKQFRSKSNPPVNLVSAAQSVNSELENESSIQSLAMSGLRVKSDITNVKLESRSLINEPKSKCAEEDLDNGDASSILCRHSIMSEEVPVATEPSLDHSSENPLLKEAHLIHKLFPSQGFQPKDIFSFLVQHSKNPNSIDPFKQTLADKPSRKLISKRRSKLKLEMPNHIEVPNDADLAQASVSSHPAFSAASLDINCGSSETKATENNKLRDESTVIGAAVNAKAVGSEPDRSELVSSAGNVWSPLPKDLPRSSDNFVDTMNNPELAQITTPASSHPVYGAASDIVEWGNSASNATGNNGSWDESSVIRSRVKVEAVGSEPCNSEFITLDMLSRGLSEDPTLKRKLCPNHLVEVSSSAELAQTTTAINSHPVFGEASDSFKCGNSVIKATGNNKSMDKSTGIGAVVKIEAGDSAPSCSEVVSLDMLSIYNSPNPLSTEFALIRELCPNHSDEDILLLLNLYKKEPNRMEIVASRLLTTAEHNYSKHVLPTSLSTEKENGQNLPRLSLDLQLSSTPNHVANDTQNLKQQESADPVMEDDAKAMYIIEQTKPLVDMKSVCIKNELSLAVESKKNLSNEHPRVRVESKKNLSNEHPRVRVESQSANHASRNSMEETAMEMDPDQSVSTWTQDLALIQQLCPAHLPEKICTVLRCYADESNRVEMAVNHLFAFYGKHTSGNAKNLSVKHTNTTQVCADMTAFTQQSNLSSFDNDLITKSPRLQLDDEPEYDGSNLEPQSSNSSVVSRRLSSAECEMQTSTNIDNIDTAIGGELNHSLSLRTRDLALIRELFPSHSNKEISAILDRYGDEPKRVQMVVNDVLTMDEGQNDAGPSELNSKVGLNTQEYVSTGNGVQHRNLPELIPPFNNNPLHLSLISILKPHELRQTQSQKVHRPIPPEVNAVNPANNIVITRTAENHSSVLSHSRDGINSESQGPCHSVMLQNQNRENEVNSLSYDKAITGETASTLVEVSKGDNEPENKNRAGCSFARCSEASLSSSHTEMLLRGSGTSNLNSNDLRKDVIGPTVAVVPFDWKKQTPKITGSFQTEKTADLKCRTVQENYVHDVTNATCSPNAEVACNSQAKSKSTHSEDMIFRWHQEIGTIREICPDFSSREVATSLNLYAGDADCVVRALNHLLDVHNKSSGVNDIIAQVPGSPLQPEVSNANPDLESRTTSSCKEIVTPGSDGDAAQGLAPIKVNYEQPRRVNATKNEQQPIVVEVSSASEMKARSASNLTFSQPSKNSRILVGDAVEGLAPIKVNYEQPRRVNATKNEQQPIVVEVRSASEVKAVNSSSLTFSPSSKNVRLSLGYNVQGLAPIKVNCEHPCRVNATVSNQQPIVVEVRSASEMKATNASNLISPPSKNSRILVGHAVEGIAPIKVNYEQPRRVNSAVNNQQPIVVEVRSASETKATNASNLTFSPSSKNVCISVGDTAQGLAPIKVNYEQSRSAAVHDQQPIVVRVHSTSEMKAANAGSCLTSPPSKKICRLADFDVGALIHPKFEPPLFHQPNQDDNNRRSAPSSSMLRVNTDPTNGPKFSLSERGHNGVTLCRPPIHSKQDENIPRSNKTANVSRKRRHSSPGDLEKPSVKSTENEENCNVAEMNLLNVKFVPVWENGLIILRPEKSVASPLDRPDRESPVPHHCLHMGKCSLDDLCAGCCSDMYHYAKKNASTLSNLRTPSEGTECNIEGMCCITRRHHKPNSSRRFHPYHLDNCYAERDHNVHEHPRPMLCPNHSSQPLCHRHRSGFNFYRNGCYECNSQSPPGMVQCSSHSTVRCSSLQRSQDYCCPRPTAVDHTVQESNRGCHCCPKQSRINYSCISGSKASSPQQVSRLITEPHSSHSQQSSRSRANSSVMFCELPECSTVRQSSSHRLPSPGIESLPQQLPRRSSSGDVEVDNDDQTKQQQ